MSNLNRWAMGVALAAFMAFAPYLFYRYTLEHTKRLRPVVEGRVYRSGCLTADGFRDAITKHKIKTVITLWDEEPDPSLPVDRFTWRTIKESELCKELGVDFHFVYVILKDDADLKDGRMPAIEKFLKIMDDEASYPVLFHCKAGLHRTGVMAAIYRMEYEGYSRAEAMRELRANGFGNFAANRSNPYIRQYVLTYQPRTRVAPARAVEARPVMLTRPEL